jgi:hypothetical protein
MPELFNCIAISGVSTSGKTTLFKLISKILLEKHINCEKYSFAEDLKIILNEFLLKEFGISTFTIDPKQKEIIRPILISFAEAKRKINSLFWVERIEPKVINSINNHCLPCIDDLRYPNEEAWIKKMNGITIHITRFDKLNNEVLPFSKEESENNPIIKERADYKLSWPTSNDYNLLESIVRTQLKNLIDLF